MIKFQSFLSGSSGNCTYITDDETHLLVDCGATGKYITECLSRIGVSPAQICAIFVTHEHHDHTAGIGVMSRKFSIPVYATEGTWRGMKSAVGKVFAQHTIRADEILSLGELQIQPFPIPHDAHEPVGYRFSDATSSFAIATDIGHVNDALFSVLQGCESLILEANHDLAMLTNGRYPYPLKMRIAGIHGHLSNESCGKFCAQLVKSGTKSIWLGHLSQENNEPSLAFETVRDILKREGIAAGSDVGLTVLPRYWLK